MKKKSDQPLTKLANAAFRKATRKVIERAERTGTPMIVWKDEKVKELEPRKTRTARKRNGHAAG